MKRNTFINGKIHPFPASAQKQNSAPAQINPGALADVTCPNCGGESFLSGIALKQLPSVHPQNQTGADQVLTVPVLVCCVCFRQLGKSYPDDNQRKSIS